MCARNKNAHHLFFLFAVKQFISQFTTTISLLIFFHEFQQKKKKFNEF